MIPSSLEMIPQTRNDSLKSRTDSLEEALANADEEAKVKDIKTNVSHLHPNLNHLENRNYSLVNEVVEFEKGMKVKEEEEVKEEIKSKSLWFEAQTLVSGKRKVLLNKQRKQ